MKKEWLYALVGVGVLYLLWKHSKANPASAATAAAAAAPAIVLPNGQQFNPLDTLSQAVGLGIATLGAVNAGSDSADVFGPTMQDGSLYTSGNAGVLPPPGSPVGFTLQNFIPIGKTSGAFGNNGTPIYSPPPPRNLDS